MYGGRKAERVVAGRINGRVGGSPGREQPSLVLQLQGTGGNRIRQRRLPLPRLRGVPMTTFIS